MENRYQTNIAEGSYLRTGGRRAYLKSLGVDGPHVPNKFEAKLLRKLQSQTGLSVEEIRLIKAYRIQLSDAAKLASPGYISDKRKDRFIKRLMKSVCQELKLAKEHPLVLKRFNTLYHKAMNDGYHWFLRY